MVAGICRECGCTAEDGCTVKTTLVGSGEVIYRGCDWLEPDLCSGCKPSFNEERVKGPVTDHRATTVYNKYVVTHKDGRPVDPNKRYFVLAPESDAAAMVALRAYVTTIVPSNPQLALDLVNHYDLTIDSWILGMARDHAALSYATLVLASGPSHEHTHLANMFREIARQQDSLLVALWASQGRRSELERAVELLTELSDGLQQRIEVMLAANQSTEAGDATRKG